MLAQSRPQGGACCGLNRLRPRAQSLHCRWQLPVCCFFLLGRRSPSNTGTRVPVPHSMPLLPAHHGLGSRNIHFLYNPERDNWDKNRKSFYAWETPFLERFNSQLAASSRAPASCSSQPFCHNSSNTCSFPASFLLLYELLSSILYDDSDYSHPLRHSQR